MSKLQKKSISKIMNRCVKFISLFVVMLTSIFYVACGKKSSAAASDLDAYGKYRLDQVTDIEFYNITYRENCRNKEDLLFFKFVHCIKKRYICILKNLEN